MGFSVPGMDGSLLGQPLHYPQHQVGAGIPGGVTLFPGQPAVVEAVSTPLVPTGGMPSDIAQLLVKGRSHWLKGNELVKLLQHGMEGNFPLSAAAADLPPSGTLFMYDRKQVRFFRLDGHNWRKKHDGKTVRETHEKLKVDNVDALNCYYAHALEPFNLQRRCYWMLDNDKYVLVHYLETGFGSKRAANRWNELLEQQPEMKLRVETDSEGRPIMPSPSNSASALNRRRSSLESSRLSEGTHSVGYPTHPTAHHRVSFEETSRRKSSMDDSRDTYAMHPPGSWSAANQSTNQRRTPWGAMAVPMPAMPPWQMPKVPEVNPPMSFNHMSGYQTMGLQPQKQGDNMDVDAVSRHTSDNMQGRPSLDDSAASPQDTGHFSIWEISPQAVSVNGGDKVLIVGSPSPGCELRGGLYVEVDGVRCNTQVIQSGVISFMTRPHARGLARVVIWSASGQVLSSTAAMEFCEPMLSSSVTGNMSGQATPLQ
eukprot:CAMPEP_0177757558 /NCGR_PEP_ID=MMETSP0491_2-20121128/3705_1 /TAXON_ID=63592 /ORGANISM="Tetraselmis chuii, Strain PLY429" /LENGTH=481 /DNA_ID=CAMNT_0019273213 /DNA_START=519 /DNA_END=1964 /DNA_ORIENTATION=-